MANVATVAVDQVGAYELALTAATAVQVAVNSYQAVDGDMRVTSHPANTAPVYARYGSTVVTAKDPYATVILPGQTVTIRGRINTTAATVQLISSAAAVVSVFRA